MNRFRAAELADELDISERDVIDVAHDAGCTEFFFEGHELEYDDFDRVDPISFLRGVCRSADAVIDLADVELIIDGPVADQFSYLTGWDR